MTSRKGTIRSAGCIWQHDGEGWSTDVNERVSATTWKFGSIHQCKVFIKYPQMRASAHNGKSVGIGLQCQPTMRSAMKHGVEWAQNYIENDPKSVEQVFADCFAHWPTIYGTRVSVIEHLFFVIGNGYEWLDGAIVSTGPEDYIEAQQRREYRKNNPDPEMIKRNKLFQDLLDKPDTSEEVKKICRDALGLLNEDDIAEREGRPVPDDGELIVFYPVCNYSEIMRVPDDVRPDWLALSYEAAILLRDRSGISEHCRTKYPGAIEDNEVRCIENIEIGARIVNELEQRFPQLVR
jgi:hypothetical protein